MKIFWQTETIFPLKYNYNPARVPFQWERKDVCMSFVLVLISCNIFISAVFLRFLIKFNFLLKPIKTLFKIYSTSKEPSNKETISCVDVVLRKMIILKPTLNVVLSCRQCPRGLPPECRQHGVLLRVQEEQLIPQASSIPRSCLFRCSLFFARIKFLCSFKCVSLVQTLLVQCHWIFSLVSLATYNNSIYLKL